MEAKTGVKIEKKLEVTNEKEKEGKQERKKNITREVKKEEKKEEKKTRCMNAIWVDYLLAFLFSLITGVGACYAFWHSLKVVFSLPGSLLFPLAFLGFFLLYRYLLALCFAGLWKLEGRILEGGEERTVEKEKIEEVKTEEKEVKKDEISTKEKTRKEEIGLEEEKKERIKRYLVYFGFLMLCYGFYLFFFYPGTLVPDGRKQLSQGLFFTPLTNMHPYLFSLVMGAVCRLGMHISDNAGFFLVVFTMAVLEAACYAAIPCILGSWGVKKTYRVACLLFLGLFPPFGAYAQTLIKDGPAAALTALFFTWMLDAFRKGKVMREREKEKKQKAQIGGEKSGEEEIGERIEEVREEVEETKENRELKAIRKNKEEIGSEIEEIREIKEEKIPYLTLFLLGALVCLTRRNGSYLVLPCFLLLAFYLVGKRRLIGGLLVVATVGLLWGNGRLGDALGVERASMRVYYSVLFQQTARFYREYPKDVKKKEKKAVKGVLSGKKLGELYNPELSDPVKNTFREDASKKAMKKYLKAYLAMGKRHPLVYVDAFLEGCYGYYYPFRLSEVSSPWYLDRGESYSKKLPLSLHHLFPVWLRKVASVFAYAFRKVPILKITVTPGFYTWVYLVLAGFLIKRKKAYALWPFILPLMLLGVCTLCPVNGAVRYFLPLMGSFPACLAYVLTCPASVVQKKR